MTAILWLIVAVFVGIALGLTLWEWEKRRRNKPRCDWCHEPVKATHPCPCGCGNDLCPRCIRVVNHHVRAKR